MTGAGIVGTGTPVDAVLSEYLPERPDNLLYQAFESETNALLFALLMEHRGDRNPDDAAEEAVYHAGMGIDVDTDEEDTVEWDFPASAVTVYGFDEPVSVAFKGPNTDDREIKLGPSQAPFSLAPEGGLRASKLWYRKPNNTTNDTTINVVALR